MQTRTGTGTGTNYSPLVMRASSAEHINGAYVRHNVSSTDGLFRSELAGTGETVMVTGTEKLNPARTSFCEPHSGMKGQLIVR